MNVDDILQRWKGLKDRSTQEALWQDLAELMLPNRAGFTRTRVQGEENTDEVMDSTPMQARRRLSAAVNGLLKPVGSRWLAMKAVDSDLEDDDEAKRWFEHVEELMWSAIYNPRAGFVARSGEVDDDLAALGTGVLFIGTNRAGDALLFRTHHLKDTWIAEDEAGRIDTVFVHRELTARQAVQIYGNNAGEDALKALRENRPQEKCKYLNAVMPRKDRDPRRIDNLNMPFAHYVVDIKGERMVEESGYHEFPFAVPRWETAPGEVYGRSPGMDALPDVRTLNEMRRTVLDAGQRAVDPPLAAPAESMINEAHLGAGGFFWYDPTQVSGNARNAVFPLVSGANVGLGLDMEQQTREMIWAAFYRDVLQLPVQGPEMTATEVLQRREEMLQVVGPTFARMETDYIGPIAERVFGIMMRAGEFDDPPEVLQGRRVEFEFRSAVQQIRRRIQVSASQAMLEQAAALGQFDPTVLDLVNGEQILRDFADAYGAPQDHLFGDEHVQQVRQQRAQAQQAEAMAQAGERIAGAAGAAAPALKALAA